MGLVGVEENGNGICEISLGTHNNNKYRRMDSVVSDEVEVEEDDDGGERLSLGGSS